MEKRHDDNKIQANYTYKLVDTQNNDSESDNLVNYTKKFQEPDYFLAFEKSDFEIKTVTDNTNYEMPKPLNTYSPKKEKMNPIEKKSRRIRKKDKTQKKKRKNLTILKRYIGSIVTAISFFLHQEMKKINSVLTKHVVKLVEDRHETNPDVFQSIEEFKTEFYERFNKIIAGKKEVSSVKVYKVATRDNIKEILFNNSPAKVDLLNSVARGIINFFFENDEYYEKLASKVSQRNDTNKDFMIKNKQGILNIFNNPDAPPLTVIE